MKNEMKRWNAIAAATDDPQTQGPWPDDLRDEWRAVLAGRKTIWESGAFPLQRRREHEAMIALARGRGAKVIMEIGADKGGGLLGWLALSPDILIANEVRGCPYSDLLAPTAPDTRFYFSEASSYAPATIRAVGEFLGGRTIDVLFIDGNKCEFERDFVSYRNLISPGGLVFMHDIQDAAPGRAFAAVSERYATGKIIDTTEAAEVAMRNHNGIPPRNYHEQWLLQWGGRSAGVGVIYVPVQE